MTLIQTEDVDGAVRILRLAKPPAHAIDEALLLDLQTALRQAMDDSSVRAVVLTGSGRFFSAGFDFAAPHRDAAAVNRMMDLYRRVHVELLSLPKPTLAMVNGHAIAGGAILVLACDYRLAVDGEYKVGLNEISVGATFPRVAFEIAALRLSHARASEMMLGASLYPVSQATRLGLVDEMLPAETFEATTLRRAARLAAFPREAYAHTKAALIAPALERIAAESAEQAAHAAALWSTEESRAARRRLRAALSLRGSD